MGHENVIIVSPGHGDDVVDVRMAIAEGNAKTVEDTAVNLLSVRIPKTTLNNETK